MDVWAPFSNNADESIIIREMNNMLSKDKIFPIFWRNIKYSKLESLVIPIRCKSEDILFLFGNEKFDFIYLDASHAYSDFIYELKNTSRLLKNGGFLCGDDLELQVDQIDKKNARANKEMDYILDPKSGKHFHPGVCLGIADFFKRKISNYEGFWIVKKNKSSYSDVLLSE